MNAHNKYDDVIVNALEAEFDISQFVERCPQNAVGDLAITAQTRSSSSEPIKFPRVIKEAPTVWYPSRSGVAKPGRIPLCSVLP